MLLKSHFLLEPSTIPLLLPNIFSTLFLWHVLQPTLYKNVCFYTSHLLDLRMACHRSLVGCVPSNWLPRPRVVQGQEGEALLPHFTDKETEVRQLCHAPDGIG